MGEVPGHALYYLFYTVECASCAKALNKPTEVFLHAYWLCILSYTKNGQTKLEALYVKSNVDFSEHNFRECFATVGLQKHTQVQA